MTTKEGEPDDGSVLRAALKKASAKAPVGASYRWALNVTTERELQLQMQSLPATSNVVEGSPILMGDNVATVAIKTWDLEAVVFDDKKARGLVPIFFSENTRLTGKCLDESPNNILAWHSKIMKR